MEQTLSEIPQADQARFWRKVNKQSGGCWLWTASTLRRGYGSTTMAGRTRAAHRVAWQIANGPIPPGLVVMHSCDAPGCVNPAHLSLGTQADNMRDMAAKGRSTRGVAGVAGEASPTAKLTEADVLAIRARYEEGGISHRALGAQFGVSHTQVRHIIIRQAWGHV